MSINNTAAKWIASVFGVFAGLGGALHGVGELLQGEASTPGLFILSWASGPIAEHMGGDPAISVAPNFLITGIFAIVISVSLIAWSVAFLQLRSGGRVQLFLAIALLMCGGGVGPPVLGILASVGALGIRSSHAWWHAHLPTGLHALLAGSWPWVFGLCVLNGFFLIAGHVILVFFWEVTNPDIFLASFFLAVILILSSILTGMSYDIRSRYA